jgi:hypothetical protein
VVLPSKDKWSEDPDMIIFHRMMVRHVPATLPLSLVAWPGSAWLRAGFINEELSGDHHHISEQPANQEMGGKKRRATCLLLRHNSPAITFSGAHPFGSKLIS